jgi:signal transduction histidine kinase
LPFFFSLIFSRVVFIDTLATGNMKFRFFYYFFLASVLSHYAFGQTALSEPSMNVAKQELGSYTHAALDNLSQKEIYRLISRKKEKANTCKQTDPDSAQHLLNEALFLAHKTQEDGLLASVYFQLGTLYSEKGAYNRAVEHYYIGLQYYERKKNFYEKSGYPYVDIGNLFYRLEQKEQALQFYRKSLAVFSLYPDQKKEGWGRTLAMSNMGLCFLNLEMADSALVYFNDVLNVRKQMLLENQVDSSLISYSYLYLARAYQALNNHEEVDQMLTQAQRFVSHTPTVDNRAIQRSIDYYHSLAFLQRGKLKRAFETALNLINENPTPENLAFSIQLRVHLVEVCIKLNKDGIANEQIELGLIEAKQIDDTERIIELYRLQSKVLENQDSFLLAEKALLQATYYFDSLQLKEQNTLGSLLDLNIRVASAQVANQQLIRKNTDIKDDAELNETLLIISIVLLAAFLAAGLIIYLLFVKSQRNKENEYALRQRITKLIDSIKNTILCINMDGEIVFINNACQTFYSKVLHTELNQGDNFLEALNTVGRKKIWLETLDKATALKRTWQDERTAEFSNLVYLQHINTPILNEKGEVLSLVVVGTDVTTLKLQEKQLQEQKQKLAETNQAKQQMLNLLAHDLKDAIYSAHTLAELVLDNQDNYDHKGLIELFELLHTNFGKNRAMIEGLLSWAKTQVEGIKANYEQFNLATLVDETVAQLKERIEGKSIRLVISVDTAASVHADKNMIQAILRNLISNAIKFSPKNEGVIEVKCVERDEKVEISVQDNGIGIKENTLKDLFKTPRINQTQGTAGELGSGFGLNICKEYLRLHNSTLEVDSTLGSGSTFKFILSKQENVSGVIIK